MYCTNCQKEINDGSIFCVHCGAKQEVKIDTPAAPEETPVSPEVQQAAPEETPVSPEVQQAATEEAPVFPGVQQAAPEEAPVFPGVQQAAPVYTAPTAPVYTAPAAYSAYTAPAVKSGKGGRIALLCLAGLCVILIIATVVLFFADTGNDEKIAQLQGEYTAAQDALNSKQSELSAIEQENEDIAAQVEAIEQDIGGMGAEYELIVEKADFLYSNLLFANYGENVCHYYGCEDLDISNSWAMNSEGMLGDGYALCNKCS